MGRLTGRWQTLVDRFPVTATSGWAYGYGDFVYYVGGTQGGVPSSRIWVARMLDDGNLGSWKLAGNAGPNQISMAFLSAVAHGGFLYTYCGLSDAANRHLLLVGRIQPDGTLGPWRQWGTPQNATDNRQAVGLVVAGQNLYAIGGWGGGAFPRETRYCRLYPDGSIGPWQLGPEIPSTIDVGIRFWPVVIEHAGYIYLVSGGLNNQVTTMNPETDTVYSVQVFSDGSLGQWKLAGSIPIKLVRAGAAKLGNLLVVAGGYSGPNGGVQDRCWTATLEPGGSLGPWAEEERLPVAHRNTILVPVRDKYIVAPVGFTTVNLDVIQVYRP